MFLKVSASRTFPGLGRLYHGVGQQVPPGFAVHAGGQLVAALRDFPELLHLYIDAERVFPQAEVRDEEILALARQHHQTPFPTPSIATSDLPTLRPRGDTHSVARARKLADVVS